MAICTRHPFIQIFKVTSESQPLVSLLTKGQPVLLLALDDYFANPSQECLARLFDAINSMDISAAPALTRFEKLIMRASERKVIFAEKFSTQAPPLPPKSAHKTTSSNGSQSSEDGVLIGSTRARSTTTASDPIPTHPSTPSDSSFSLGGSAVWVNDDSVLIDGQVGVAIGAGPGSVGGASMSGSSLLTSRGRRSTDASSSSSHAHSGGAIPTSSDPQLRSGISKDTHFFQTSIAYKGHTLPIKLPLATFPEEVGEVRLLMKMCLIVYSSEYASLKYSLIQLIQTFSTPPITVSGPLHPHLHTNGSLTHPIIILFNALVTGKRILFLGHSIPAGQVANYVLSACALGSGCGAILRGFIERAFPYAGLAGGEDWASTYVARYFCSWGDKKMFIYSFHRPAYIAGVTNPIFETSAAWDVLMDIGTARVVVHKDIHLSFPPTVAPPALVNTLMTRPLKTENSTGSEDDIQRIATRDGKEGSQKNEFAAKPDSLDNMFIEDVSLCNVVALP